MESADTLVTESNARYLQRAAAVITARSAYDDSVTKAVIAENNVKTYHNV
jgi:hypothetical protein